MGLILDSSILISGERRGQTLKEVIDRVRFACGDVESALSTISVIELSHGIYRAKADLDRLRRRLFVEEVCRDMVIHPVTLAIAQLAGQIEGEEAAKGITIAIDDLIIGATALHFGFDVATLNLKQFRLIPGLKTVSL
jgi:predicted nucleic acid-binding protein